MLVTHLSLMCGCVIMQAMVCPSVLANHIATLSPPLMLAFTQFTSLLSRLVSACSTPARPNISLTESHISLLSLSLPNRSWFGIRARAGSQFCPGHTLIDHDHLVCPCVCVSQQVSPRCSLVHLLSLLLAILQQCYLKLNIN